MANFYAPPTSPVGVGQNPVRVVPVLTGRPAISLANLGPAPVWVGTVATVTPGTGTLVSIGNTYTDTTGGALWAVTTGGQGNSAVAVLLTTPASLVRNFTAGSIPFGDPSGALTELNPGLTWLGGILSLPGANGDLLAIGSASELLTLSTGGATTDTTANLLPAASVILAVTGRVTTTITTATDWKLGDATTAGRFTAADSTMTANETAIGILQWSGAVTTLAAGPSQAAAAKVRVTTTGTPGAGAIRITVWYQQFTAPTA